MANDHENEAEEMKRLSRKEDTASLTKEERCRLIYLEIKDFEDRETMDVVNTSLDNKKHK
jgi:hypothetical protein